MSVVAAIPLRRAVLSGLMVSMFIPVLLAVLAADLRPLDLGAMSVERARTLQGHTVTACFVVGRPMSTLLNKTMAATAERDDDVERGAVLLGKRFDLREGERITVQGKLRLIEHRGSIVNGVIVQGWLEIRVEELKEPR